MRTAVLTDEGENVRLFVSRAQAFSDIQAEWQQKFAKIQGWHTFSS